MTPLAFYTSETKDRTASVLNSFRNQGLQFCVTAEPLPTKKITFDADLSANGKHIAISEPVMLDVSQENAEYEAQPYITKITPATTSTYNLTENGNKTHVKAIYNKPLKATGKVSITVDTPNANVTARVRNVTWSNITYEGKPSSVVEFDVTFDNSYNSQFAVYDFHINNLVGETSGKKPNKISYMTSFYRCSEVYLCDNNNTNRIGTIHMSQSRELGQGNIVLGEDYVNLDHYNLDEYDTNILLVAQKGKQSKVYSLKYNFASAVEEINKGYAATLAVPYPDGFGKNSNYKAYKFLKTEDGNYVEQELATRISAQGLEVSHGSFGGELLTAEEKVEFFDDANYGGASISLGVGSYNINELGALGNDRLSSIIIPEGYTVTLYEHGNFGGKAVKCTENMSFLRTIRFNDATSSIVIEKNK